MNQNKSVKIRFKGFTEAWEQRKFQEITQRVSTSSISSIDFPSVEYEDIEAGSGTLNKDVKLKEKNKKGIVFDKNDILFGKLRPYLMNWLLADFKGVAVGDYWVLRSQNFDPKFVYSLIQSKSFQEVANRSSGSKMPRADWKLVSNTLFFVPSQNNEQRKIGELFSSLDKVITLHQRKLNRFQKIRTTFLQKMFPKNGETKPAIRLTGFNADWEQEKLQNFAVRITRKNIKKQNNRPLTISAQHGLVDQTVYFNNRVAAQDVSNYYLIKKGEFAYNRSTSKDAPVGAVRRLVDYEEGVLSTLYLVFSITDPQHVDPNYLSYFFETTGWHSWILERAAEGARNHGLLNVSSQDFLSLPVMLPSSLEEQRKIGEFFQKIDDCIILLERQADLLKQIKSSLLLSMFPPSNAE